MMTDAADILGLIDAAVEDWKTSPDAVRYNGPEPAGFEGFGFGWLASINMIRAAADFERQMLQLQQGMATLVGTLDPAPFELLAQNLLEMSQQWTCFACGASWYGAGGHECTWTPLDRAFEHQIKVQLLKAYRVRPHEIGIGDMGCACHSAPFPAARDYRRRTKHRNRRRR